MTNEQSTESKPTIIDQNTKLIVTMIYTWGVISGTIIGVLISVLAYFIRN